MKKTVYKSDFIEAFQAVRPDQFSRAGLSALYDYFEDCGQEIELDVIAICCEFTEYADIQEFVADYGDSYIHWDVEPEEADDESEAIEGEVDYEKTLDNIGRYTQVIDINGESFIIQDF
jgi:hypothetical protein